MNKKYTNYKLQIAIWSLYIEILDMKQNETLQIEVKNAIIL